MDIFYSILKTLPFF